MIFKINSINKIQYIFRIFILLITTLFSNSLFADGSKDLYPSGVTGLRAYLRSTTVATENWPFPNQGTHYVYAKAGERIALASSAQNGGSAAIRLTSPGGALLINNTTAGQITNRTAEIAGPQLVGGSVSNRYTSIYYLVPANGAGIYKVEFLARGIADPSTTFEANFNWTQTNQPSDAGILAWDVSIINSGNTAFIPGRVYTNVLNLTNGTGSPNSNGFYGTFYTLTKDGYTYRVKNNGNNGLYFTFFVNNNGFIDATTQNPVYKSLNGSSPAFLAGKVHDPTSADTAKNITHKMFYVLPNNDLPATGSGAVPGPLTTNDTWLKSTIVVPQVTNVSITGVEGVVGQVSKKGGYIRFTADVQGNYNISIQGTAANPGFVTRVLTGSSISGNNQILWDGKDGAGNSSPVGTYPITITIRLQGAEVHFPYIDMEYNRFGTVVELLNNTLLDQTTPVIQAVSNRVYWDDSDIPNATSGSNSNPKNNSQLPPTNSPGLNSNNNGHIWGVNGTGTNGLFGDIKAIDTWTFIQGEATTVSTSVNVRSADLKVSSISPDITNLFEGDTVIYTVKVKNDGPNDVSAAPFSFKIPTGLSPQNIQFLPNSCGSQSTAISFNAATQTYNAQLNLPNGCEITYNISLVVTSQTIQGNQQVQAAILRTNDMTDPDATNPDIAVLPTDPYAECANNGIGGNCNNIQSNNALIVKLVCYDLPNATGTATATNHGITLLQRAGVEGGNWPMLRNSGFTALESNKKGFVITRLSTTQITALVSPQEGMMIYDTTENCLKLYDGTAWSCFSKPACP